MENAQGLHRSSFKDITAIDVRILEKRASLQQQQQQQQLLHQFLPHDRLCSRTIRLCQLTNYCSVTSGRSAGRFVRNNPTGSLAANTPAETTKLFLAIIYWLLLLPQPNEGKLCFYLCLFVCLTLLSAGLLNNLWMDIGEIFWRGGAWPKNRSIRFCWSWSTVPGSGSRYRSSNFKELSFTIAIRIDSVEYLWRTFQLSECSQIIITYADLFTTNGRQKKQNNMYRIKKLDYRVCQKSDTHVNYVNIMSYKLQNTRYLHRLNNFNIHYWFIELCAQCVHPAAVQPEYKTTTPFVNAAVNEAL